MSCGVSLSSYDDWYYGGGFYSERTVRARKPHRCKECGRTIKVGASYVRVAGKHDGSVWSEAICAPCMSLLKSFSEDGSWCFGEMWGEFRSAWNSGASLQGCMNRVSTVAEKVKLRDEWIAWRQSVISNRRESQEAPHAPTQEAK